MPISLFPPPPLPLPTYLPNFNPKVMGEEASLKVKDVGFVVIKSSMAEPGSWARPRHQPLGRAQRQEAPQARGPSSSGQQPTRLTSPLY